MIKVWKSEDALGFLLLFRHPDGLLTGAEKSPRRSNHEKMAAMNGRSSVWRISVLSVVVSVLFVFTSQAQQHRTGRISGQVVDSVGATIKEASIFVHKHASSENALGIAAHTDIEGNFTLELPEGGYDMFVTASGFEAGAQTIPVRPGKTKSVRWTLKALGCDFPTLNCDTFY